MSNIIVISYPSHKVTMGHSIYWHGRYCWRASPNIHSWNCKNIESEPKVAVATTLPGWLLPTIFACFQSASFICACIHIPLLYTHLQCSIFYITESRGKHVTVYNDSCIHHSHGCIMTSTFDQNNAGISTAGFCCQGESPHIKLS